MLLLYKFPRIRKEKVVVYHVDDKTWFLFQLSSNCQIKAPSTADLLGLELDIILLVLMTPIELFKNNIF